MKHKFLINKTISAISLVLTLGLFSRGDAIEYIGKGCTTAFWIDEDCDGFVIGGKDGVVRANQVPVPQPPTLDADANDNDPSINTPQSVTQRFGDFSNIENFKNFLRTRYSHPVRNVYFVSLTGDNSTAQPNDINRPYFTSPVPFFLNPPIVGPGDVIVFRGGRYLRQLDTFGHRIPVPNSPQMENIGYQGTEQQPILLMAYPGERVIFSGSAVAFGFTRRSEYTIVDGLEFDGYYPPQNSYARQVVGLDQNPTTNCTLVNCEIRNGDRWGIFGSQIQGRNNITLDHLVIHHIGLEHCIYRNNGDALPEATEDSGWVIKNSLFYISGGHGIHWRGGKDFTFENNIIHTVTWFGIEMKNGCKNGTLRNNLIFNAGRGPLVMWNDGDRTTIDDSGIHNMLFENNIFYSKVGSNGLSEPTAFSAVRIDRHQVTRPYRNIRFYNNIFYPSAAVPIEVMQYDALSEIRLENNIFFRGSNGTTGMMTCQTTDGSHSSVNSESGGICPGPAYFWTFEAMQNPTLRPQIVNNRYANPNFTDVNANYTVNITPGLFNFNPTQNSPTIDFANPNFVPATDLRRNPRVGRPDAGAYEFNVPSPNLAPIVNAGPEQSILYPENRVDLSGVVSDDGLPNPPGVVSSQWSKKSGTGNVVFSNSSSPNTTATFSAPGIYDLRLSATDGALFADDIVRITVIDPNIGQNQNPGQSLNFGETRFSACMDPNEISARKNIPICLHVGNSAQNKQGSLEIYSKSGQKVRHLFSGVLSGGENRFVWDTKNDTGESQSSGIYVLVYKHNGKVLAKSKIPLLK